MKKYVLNTIILMITVLPTWAQDEECSTTENSEDVSCKELLFSEEEILSSSSVVAENETDDDDNSMLGDYDSDDEDYDEYDDDVNDEHNETDCYDSHEKCENWQKIGECEKNPRYMLMNCARSCGVCDYDSEMIEETISQLQHFGEIQNTETKEGEELLQSMHKYMMEEVLIDAKYKRVRDICRNQDADCITWAVRGECEANPAYMTPNCAPACRTCHLMLYEERCPWIPSNETNAWQKPGDLDRMFRRIVDLYENNTDSKLNVLSQPTQGRERPWVVTIDNFLSFKETETLIELGKQQGYERSLDLGEEKADGSFGEIVSPDRTSTNAWCVEDCYNNSTTKEILHRIENLTHIPDAHGEYLQLLNYDIGQKYSIHHDYIGEAMDRPEGVRILTIFLYLNDVLGGGGTNFPQLDLTVMPKRGRVLIWPSVLNEDPNEIDYETEHQALPVEKGVKYAANAWIHNRDYKEPFSRGCYL